MRRRADETTPATAGDHSDLPTLGADLVHPGRYGGADKCFLLCLRPRPSLDLSQPWSRPLAGWLAGWLGHSHENSTEEPEALLLFTRKKAAGLSYMSVVFKFYLTLN